MINCATGPLSGFPISSLHECTQVGLPKGFIYNQQTATLFFCCLPVLMELLVDLKIIAFTWLYALAFTT